MENCAKKKNSLYAKMYINYNFNTIILDLYKMQYSKS